MSATGWQKDRIALAQQPIVALTGNCKTCTAVQNDDPFGFVLVIPITRWRYLSLRHNTLKTNSPRAQERVGDLANRRVRQRTQEVCEHHRSIAFISTPWAS